MAVWATIEKEKLEDVTTRIDAEYYKPEYLDVEKKLGSVKTTTLGEMADSVISFGAYSLTNYIEWQQEGVPYLNVGDIHDGFIDFSNIKFISARVDDILKKSRVKEGQIIITMAGTIGNVAVAYKIPARVNSNQATAKITIKKGVSPYYISAFLNSFYGQKQIKREIVSSVQPNIFLWQIKAFKVPLADARQQKHIEDTYKTGLEKLEKSELFYTQAQQKLLDELGISELNLSHDLSYTANSKEVIDVDRVDAEYFQPKHLKLLSHLKKFHSQKLGELVTIKKGVEIGSEAYQEEGIPFVRVSNLTALGINNDDQKCLSQTLYDELKNKFEPRKGELLLTKDATPDNAFVLKEQPQAIISGGILRLKVSKEIDSEYLALVLNSMVGKWQAERDTGGSVIVHWRPEQIKDVTIPVLDVKKQKELADLVLQSYESRQEAKKLLDEAKQKVEQIIEAKK